MKFTDTATLSGTRKTADGYLVTEAFAVRTGIQLYAGSEVGLIDQAVVRVYRSEDQVCSPASLATFAHAPVTLGHPQEAVTKDNWAELAKGEVSTEATWDGNKIKLPLIVKDAAAIAAIDAGTRELSAGYTCELEFVDGVTLEGERYDAIQKNIRVNHLAIVPRGRAGAECRIGDNAGNWGALPIIADMKGSQMTDTLQNVVLGDKSVPVAANSVAVVEAFKADTATKLSDMETAHVDALALKDTEIGTLKAEKKKLEDAAMTPEKLTTLVADRVALEASVALIDADIKTASVSDADLRKAAVVSKFGAEMVAGVTDAEISGMFKAVAVDVGDSDPFKKVADIKPPKDNGSEWGKAVFDSAGVNMKTEA